MDGRNLNTSFIRILRFRLTDLIILKWLPILCFIILMDFNQLGYLSLIFFKFFFLKLDSLKDLI